MQSNKVMWILVSIVVVFTIAISIGARNGRSQEDCSKKQANNQLGNQKNYPVVDYDSPLPQNAAEREERIIKNKRYDDVFPVFRNPDPETVAVNSTHPDSLYPAIPFNESRLIVIGEILDSKAFLSNEKKGVYSEYSVRIQTILKEDNQKKFQTGEIITVDKAGGIVRYSNDRKVLYIIDWQNSPEVNGRYLFFLNNDDERNPNYKIVTVYQLKNNKVAALDYYPKSQEFTGMSETDFLKRVLRKD